MSDYVIDAEILHALPQDWSGDHRFVIGIAGPPASGKSTLASELCAHIGARAAVLGMDAFHFDNAILEPRDHLAQKGAPNTFDADGYRRTLRLLRDTPGESIAIPVFDRQLELSRNGAEVVSVEQTILITEGNYLLFDREPWTRLRPMFDLSIFCSPSLATIESRLIERWLGYGYSPAEAHAKTHGNDLKNAKLVLAHQSSADIVLS